MLLTCWQILAEAGDLRAADALAAGPAYLDDFAGRIDEPDLRSGFLHDVAAHAALAAARKS
ncbi:MAG: hypothetical protein ACRD0A_01925 [Acidimicrobiales bacterium]